MWQQKLNENNIAISHLKQEIIEQARRIIEDPEGNFMREIGRKLKERKGTGPALTPDEQKKLSALAERQKEETARAKAIENQITALILDTLAIALAVSEKCHFSGRFGDVAEAIKKHPMVLEHAQGFWQLKWNYDTNLPGMGFHQTSCKTIESRWGSTSVHLSKLLQDRRVQ